MSEIKSKRKCLGLLVLVVLVTACALEPEHTYSPAGTALLPPLSSSATPMAPETGAPAVSPPLVTQTATATQVRISTPTLIVIPDETLMVNNDGPILYLVDDQGRSLYIYMEDVQYSGASACVDDCAVDWPPLTVSTTPAAGASVDESLVGTLSRVGGLVQATYNGWPLYYYNLDSIPGTAHGPSYDGLWFLISPKGEPVR